jgi:hypothetical protein
MSLTDKANIVQAKKPRPKPVKKILMCATVVYAPSPKTRAPSGNGSE